MIVFTKINNSHLMCTYIALTAEFQDCCVKMQIQVFWNTKTCRP